MTDKNLPEGWTQDRVDAVAQYYEQQDDELAALEDQIGSGVAVHPSAELARRWLEALSMSEGGMKVAARAVSRLNDEEVLVFFDEALSMLKMQGG